VEDVRPSDSDLWAASGTDASAFGELFERHVDAIYNHCFRRSGSWSMAEDLASRVFLTAWRKRREVRLHGDSIRPWLLALANNETRNALRGERRRSLLVRKAGATFRDIDADFSSDSDMRLDEERRMKILLENIRELRPEEQEVLALCDWSGLTYAEAADALGVPIGSVRSRLSRARAKLRAGGSGREGDGCMPAVPATPTSDWKVRSGYQP
jgi:RNA polymerase sigma factor (sigma-70 family)